MGCASSTPLVQGASPQGAPPYDLRQAADPGLQDDSVAGKVRQTVTGMADAVPVQDLIDGVSHAKDEALHKLHDFGETMKDKVESVVDDVEDKIGSAFGTAKEKTGEEMDEAVEALDKVKEDAEKTAVKDIEDAVEQEVDTMVEDLEESLPLPSPQDLQKKDFQMDTLEVRPGSQASTARLSRKSGEEEGEMGESDAPRSGDLQKDEDQKIERDSLNSFKDGSVKSLKLVSGQSNGEESEQKSSDSGLAIDEVKESDIKNECPQETDVESHHSQSRKSSTSDSTQEKDIETIENFSRQNSGEIDAIQDVETVIIETDTPLTAIPVERKDTPKQEDTEDEKGKDGKQSPLSVELPPEVKAESQPGSVEQQENATVDSETVHQTPTPIPSSQDNSRPQSSSSNVVRQPVVETPVEDTVIPPTECEIPAEDSEFDQTGRNNEEPNNLTSSPDGKNDSAISSSSISPEKNLNESDLNDRQGTPVIEVA